MAWIEVHQELRDHPKIIRLAGLLNLPPTFALGHIISLWLWATAYARDGDLSTFTKNEIAEACGAPLNQNIEECLKKAGWIDVQSGKKVLHDWKKYGLRFLDGSRKRKEKSRKIKELSDKSVTLLSRDGDAYRTNLTNLTVPTNHTMRTDKFADAWEEWLRYRINEKKKPVTVIAAKQQMKFLFSQPDPIATIEWAISHQWEGLYPIREYGKQGQGTSKRTEPSSFQGQQSKLH